MPRRMVYDRWLFFTAGVLVLFGLFMVGSASNYWALSNGSSPYWVLLKQLAFLALGLVGLFAAMRIPYARLVDRRVVLLLLALSLIALLVVLAMPAAGGAHRWLRFGVLRLQPSEFVKIVMVLFMADILSRKQRRLNELWAVPVPRRRRPCR